MKMKRKIWLLAGIFGILLFHIGLDSAVFSEVEKEHVIVAAQPRLDEHTIVVTKVKQVYQEQGIYTYGMLQEDIIALCTAYPDIVRFEILGQSADGRNIYQIIFGNPKAQRAAFIQASIHGREYMTTQLVMDMLAEYAANYHTGNFLGVPYEVLFEQMCFYIIPMSNPDGVTISQYGEVGILQAENLAMVRNAFQWEPEKKSDYADYLAKWKANARGVDINRNFDAGWENLNQKIVPSAELYKGCVPESEPETQILAGAALQRRFDCVINYHARGELIYFDAAGNTAEMSSCSQALAVIANQINGYRMVNCQDSSAVVLGGFGDWMMLKQGVPSITIEIGKGTCPLSQAEYPEIWNRNKEMWSRIAVHFLTS